jgi:hypothetical protein
MVKMQSGVSPEGAGTRRKSSQTFYKPPTTTYLWEK